MVKKHVRMMAYFAQSALIVAACTSDDTGNSDSATSSGGETSSTSTTTGTETSTSTTTSDPTTSTTSPETTTTTTTTTGTTTEGGDSADAFRFTEMFVRDPHFFIVPIIGCEDITDKGLLGSPSINEQFNDAITMDTSDPPDGFLNLNFMLLLRPLDQEAVGGDFDFATGECTAPIESTSCDIKMDTQPASGTYTNQKELCLEPVPEELSPAMYDPQPGSTTGPCFKGDPLSFTLDLGDFQLPFTDAEIAAQYVGDPADGMVEGLIHGFLTEEDGDSTLLPDDLPGIGGMAISSLLPGGTMNCAKHDDKDMYMGNSGWWFYIEFKATKVKYTGL
ncbi:MAG TPA: hypothetical protein ENK31_10505 [Nannocystis exedens]|nr:hypothetical protein [Nannocystis exedens]